MLGANKLGRDSGEKYYKQKQQSTGEKVLSVLRLRNNRKAVGLECDDLRGRVMGAEEEREAEPQDTDLQGVCILCSTC